MGKLRDLLRRRSGPVAAVLSGGGNHGAVQVGMLRSLVEHEIEPELVLGASIGAINGVAFAQDPTLAGIARLHDLWRGLDEAEIMPSGWLPNAVALARRGEAIQTNDALRGLLEGMLRFETFEELPLRFQCVATDVRGVREAWFSSGSMVDPILASAALPAVLPSVEIDGVRYLDGAIVNDVPISRAVELGARTIYVLHCGTIDRPRPERSARSMWPCRPTGWRDTTASSGTWRPCRMAWRPSSCPPASRNHCASTTSRTAPR